MKIFDYLKELHESLMMDLPGARGVRWRVRYFSERLANLGAEAYLSEGIQMLGHHNIRIGKTFSCGRQCFIAAHGNGEVSIGNKVAFNNNVEINASVQGKISLADNVIIGPGVIMRSSDHAYADRDKPIRDQGHVVGEIVIHEDVWIGANAVICKNVCISKGAVVGAGAVVTRDVEAYAVVAGVPAREIKKRGE